jgi:hypothetical protein
MRMSNADFKLMLDNSIKRNNRMGMLSESGIQSRMIMDDTELSEAILHEVLYHSVQNDPEGLKRLMTSIHEKNDIVNRRNDPVKGILVHEIEENENEVSRALGITQEREDTLVSIIEETVNKSLSISSTIQMISTHCIHPNEVAFCSFYIGQAFQVQ